MESLLFFLMWKLRIIMWNFVKKNYPIKWFNKYYLCFFRYIIGIFQCTVKFVFNIIFIDSNIFLLLVILFCSKYLVYIQLAQNFMIHNCHCTKFNPLKQGGGGAVRPLLPFFLPVTQNYHEAQIPENSWPCKPFCCGCPHEKKNQEI